MSSLFGGGASKAAAAQREQAEAAQRRQLAELARQQATADQEAASGGRSGRGRQLLTALEQPSLGATGKLG